MSSGNLELFACTLKGCANVCVAHLEFAYEAAAQQLNLISASILSPGSSVSDSCGDNVRFSSRENIQFRSLAWNCEEEAIVPLYINGFWATDGVEVRGIVVKARRKLSRVEPVFSATPSLSNVFDAADAGHPRCDVLVKVRSLSNDSSSTQPNVEKGKVSRRRRRLHGFSKQVGRCVQDSYCIDDGSGVVLCTQYSWVPVQYSNVHVSADQSAQVTDDVTSQMPPYKVGDFLVVRGRVAMSQHCCPRCPILPGNFSEGYIKVTSIYKREDVDEEARWFTQLYAQRESVNMWVQ